MRLNAPLLHDVWEVDENFLGQQGLLLADSQLDSACCLVTAVNEVTATVSVQVFNACFFPSQQCQRPFLHFDVPTAVLSGWRLSDAKDLALKARLWGKFSMPQLPSAGHLPLAGSPAARQLATSPRRRPRAGQGPTNPRAAPRRLPMPPAAANPPLPPPVDLPSAASALIAQRAAAALAPPAQPAQPIAAPAPPIVTPAPVPAPMRAFAPIVGDVWEVPTAFIY